MAWFETFTNLSLITSFSHHSQSNFFNFFIKNEEFSIVSSTVKHTLIVRAEGFLNCQANTNRKNLFNISLIFYALMIVYEFLVLLFYQESI